MKKLYTVLMMLGCLCSMTAQNMTSYDLNPGTPGTTPVPESAEWDATANEPLLKFQAGSYYVEALVSELEAFRNGTLSLSDFWINNSIKLNSTTTGQPLQLFRALLNFSDTKGLLITQANTTTAKNYLYKTDGKGTLNAGQTSQLTLDDLDLLDSVGAVRGHIKFKGKIVMSAEVPNDGLEIVVLDSNYNPTVIDINVNIGSGSSGPRGLYNWGDSVVFFQANDGNAGIELWRTDGTLAGTSLVKDLYSGPTGSSPENFYASGGKVYFTANDGSGIELWATDGTEMGTAKVKDLNSTTDASPLHMATGPGGLLFFDALDDSGMRRLYKTDGTNAGTVLVSTDVVVYTGGQAMPSLGGNLFFAGYPANGSNTRLLYKTDGTAAGTEVVYGLYSGVSNFYGVSNSFRMAVSNGYLYFTGNDSIHDYEIYRTDGTTAGTIRATDFAQPSTGSNFPNYLTPIPGGGVFFFGRDSIIGSELRILDLGAGVGIAAMELDVVKGAYPNPTTDLINLAIEPGDYELKLVDITGKLVATQAVQGGYGNIAFQRPAHLTQAGIYFLNVSNAQGASQTIKIVYQ